MNACRPTLHSAGSDLILQAAGRSDPRPLWIACWGGTNTLAQALLTASATKSPADSTRSSRGCASIRISDQDDAGPWIRREYPRLHYIVSPSTRMATEYYSRRGPASAAIASTATAPAPTSRRSPMRG
jgi:hypothetical protein